MRTTLTLDDDLMRELKREARHSGKSFKEVVNGTLRKGLAAGAVPAEELARFEVRPKACGFRPGIDVLKLNQLVDELAMDDFRDELSNRPGGEPSGP